MIEEPNRTAILNVVLKHLPSSREKLEGNRQVMATRADYYVMDIRNCTDVKRQISEVGWDTLEMEKLTGLLNQVLGSLDRMHYKTLRDFVWYGQDYPADSNDAFRGDDFRLLVQEAYEMAKLHFRYMSKQRPISQKRDWLAVSCVRACRSIWADEHWAIKHGEWGEGPEYELFMEDFPPQTLNHYRPGPFGRFVEEVLNSWEF